MLTDDALKLAPSRCAMPKALRNLNLVKECASDLHDALQAGWQCECDHFHPANIKLDVWSLPPEKASDKAKEDVSLKFSFLFAQDAVRAHPDHWITAEITPLNVGGMVDLIPAWKRHSILTKSQILPKDQ